MVVVTGSVGLNIDPHPLKAKGAAPNGRFDWAQLTDGFGDLVRVRFFVGVEVDFRAALERVSLDAMGGDVASPSGESL